MFSKLIPIFFGGGVSFFFFAFFAVCSLSFVGSVYRPLLSVIVCPRVHHVGISMQTTEIDGFCLNEVTDGISIADLPLKQIVGNTKLKNAVDLVKVPADVTIDKDTVLRCLQQYDLDSLPCIVKPQVASIVPYDMQIALANQQDGSNILLKHFQFADKVDIRHFQNMSVGDPHFILTMARNSAVALRHFSGFCRNFVIGLAFATKRK